MSSIKSEVRDDVLVVHILERKLSDETVVYRIGALLREMTAQADSGKLLVDLQLVEFLSSWRSASESIPERMEQLWIGLYERGYIEIDDVRQVQFWLGALLEGGYQFPNVGGGVTIKPSVTQWCCIILINSARPPRGE